MSDSNRGNPVDPNDMKPDMLDDELGAAGAAATESASRTGIRRGEDTGDIGSTDNMEASTGGLAGTSR